MAKKRSTTPIADKEKAMFAEYDKLCEFRTVSNDNVERLRCKDCNQRFKYVMSAYAMSKGGEDTLVSCGCKRRLVWLKITKGKDDEKI